MSKPCIAMPPSLLQLTIGRWIGMRHEVDACLQVLVSMSKELPVVVKYQMGDIGHIRCAVSNCTDSHGLHAHGQFPFREQIKHSAPCLQIGICSSPDAIMCSYYLAPKIEDDEEMEGDNA